MSTQLHPSAPPWLTQSSKPLNHTSVLLVRLSADDFSLPYANRQHDQHTMTICARNTTGPWMMPAKSIGRHSTLQFVPSTPMTNATSFSSLMANYHSKLQKCTHTPAHNCALHVNVNQKTKDTFWSVTTYTNTNSLRISTKILWCFVAPQCPHCVMARSTSSKNVNSIPQHTPWHPQRHRNSHSIPDKDWLGLAISWTTIHKMGTSDWHLTPSTSPVQPTAHHNHCTRNLEIHSWHLDPMKQPPTQQPRPNQPPWLPSGHADNVQSPTSTTSSNASSNLYATHHSNPQAITSVPLHMDHMK